jgi:hypothetical protein
MNIFSRNIFSKKNFSRKNSPRTLLLSVGMLLAAVPVIAQDWGSLDQDKINQMMQQGQAVQACMAEIDQSELERVQAEGEAMLNEIRSMCSAGKRGEAQSQAIVYGKEMVDEPVVKELQACVGLAGMSIPAATWSQLEDTDKAPAHVCDM